MKTFEYQSIPFYEVAKDDTTEIDTNKLNAFGNEGWDFITVFNGECVFKREIVKNENEESRESTRIYTATKDGDDESRESTKDYTVTKNENGQIEILMIGECFNSSYGDVYSHDIKAKDDRSLTDLLYFNLPTDTKVKVVVTIIDEEYDTK